MLRRDSSNLLIVAFLVASMFSDVAAKVYPAVGRDTRDGHNLVYSSVRTWERDVFAFLTVYLVR
jgi:hypothetical protein